MLIRNIFGSAMAVLLAANGFAASLGDTRLADAAKHRDGRAVQALLQQKLNVNTADGEGATAVLWASHWDDLETVKLLIAAGANVKIANGFGVTPLAEAAGLGDAALIDILLQAGADPNVTLGSGDTPLMLASRTGNMDALKTLLAHGANVSTRDSYRGETALMWAVAENHPEVVKTLIGAGADVNMRATTYASTGRGRGGVQAAPKGGMTPLLLAARQGAIESAKLLIAAGADLNAAEPEIGLSPMALAVYNDHYDFARFLVESGAKLNDGSMYVATEMRNLPTYGNRPRPKPDKLDELGFITLLLEKGADPNLPLTTRSGSLPNRESTGIVTVPAGATPFWRSARSADLVLMRVLLDHNADPNIPTKDRNTPLIAAATGRQQVTFQAGIEHTSEKDKIEAITLLMSKGLDINAVTESGDTALHGAALDGHDQVVQFLLDHGANPLAKNQAGKTPEDMAMTIINTNGGEVHPATAALIHQFVANSATRKTAQVR